MAGKSLQLAFRLPSPRSVAIQIKFKDADFSGATIRTKVNGFNMLPYHAFGGDTRYDNVKGKPGMHPPVAKIEANYSLVASWMKKGANTLSITNSGPGKAIIDSISVRDIYGHDLPRYENPIYFDFDVWQQGRAGRRGTSLFLESMLRGTSPGGGNMTLNYTGPNSIHTLKARAEEARVGWGYGNSHFYAIWYLRDTAKQWAKYVDVDNNKETTALFHHQFSAPAATPPGADIVLIDPDKLFEVLKPGIDALLPYSTYYNITCEQEGAGAQGFGMWGDKWAQQGYDAKLWANNYQDAYTKIGKYIHEKSPGAPILSTHWWQSDVRHLLFDTSLERGYKMSDMMDAMMTHFYSFSYYDFDKTGKLTEADVHPERQYPGGKFEAPNEMKSRRYMGEWVQVPEIAIDFNRYRLGRTEKDMVHGDPKINRWGDGRPFRYTAGFDGDEHIYTNEISIYDRNYSGPSPYQLLHSMFSYSLLPTAASEPQDFKITRTTPLMWLAPPSDDIFTEVDVPINRYGKWVPGAAHTQRLKTEDPLYGGLFGYTGFEYFNTGDYIWLGGIEERHHRREPFNALNLVRRISYAFVTKGEVFPAIVNNPDTNQLSVKSLVVKQNWKDIIGLYAVNFDTKPHTLDVTLPVGWNQPVIAQVFDEKASTWSDAKEQTLTPQAGMIRYQVTVPPRAPWAVFIYPPTGKAHQTFGGPTTPQPLGPWGNQNVPGEAVLRWRKVAPTMTYQVQVAREALFRREDIVHDATLIKYQGDSLPLTTKLNPDQRYHWRVRAKDDSGKSSGWSRPHSFWYQAANPTKIPGKNVPVDDAPVQESTPMREQPQAALPPFTDADNLAHTGMPYSFANYWQGAGDAVDGYAETFWNSSDLAKKPVLPAWWAVRFDTEQNVSEVRVLWADKMRGKDFDVQTWAGKAWQTIKSIKDNVETHSVIKLDAPIRTRAVRVLISTAVEKDIGIAEMYIH